MSTPEQDAMQAFANALFAPGKGDLDTATTVSTDDVAAWMAQGNAEDNDKS